MIARAQRAQRCGVRNVDKIGEEVVNEMREDVGKQGQGKGALVMLQWGVGTWILGWVYYGVGIAIWADTWVAAIDEWEVDVFGKDGWPVRQSCYICPGEDLRGSWSG